MNILTNLPMTDEASVCACGSEKVYSEERGWHCAEYFEEAAALIDYYKSGKYWEDKDNGLR